MIRYDLHENSKSDVQKNCSEVKQTEGTISTPIFMYDVGKITGNFGKFLTSLWPS